MAITKYNARLAQKSDTKANWDKATNLIPLKGEIIFYSDLNKIKIGDGVTKVGSLAFVQPSPADIGLGNVNNTSDANKPISSATQAALDQKLSLSGGTLTGDLTFSNVAAKFTYPSNQNKTIFSVDGGTEGQYGYSLQYGGAGAGNDNTLILISDNQTGDKVNAIVMKQDGTTTFAKKITASGGISGNLTGTATKATQDASGNTITSTYATKNELTTTQSNLQSSINNSIKALSVSGKTITYTKNDGTTGTITTQDTNTDTKVKHSRTTTSSFRPIILHSLYTNYGADPGTATDQLYYNEVFAAQPSTGTLKATTFEGALNGNASTSSEVNLHAISAAPTDDGCYPVGISTSFTIGDVTFPQYAKGMFVSSGSSDATLYVISADGNTYTAFRNNGTWKNAHKTIHSGNIGSQSVNYATSAGSCAGNSATATKLGDALSLKGNSSTTNVHWNPYTWTVSSAWGGISGIYAISNTETTFEGIFAVRARTSSTADVISSAKVYWLAASHNPPTLTITGDSDSSVPNSVFKLYLSANGTYQTWKISKIREYINSASTESNTAVLTAITGTVKHTSTTVNLASFGVTATADELNYVDGVTSNIQTQLDALNWSSGGTSIPSNSDLNNYTTPGKYTVDSVALAGTMTNAPTTTENYALYVIKRTSGGAITQIVITLNAKVYLRSSGNDITFSDWKEIINSSNIGSQSVNYATSAGNATTATKLGTSAGSATQPVYFSDGKPVATTYTLGKSVPSDAKFTDTTYSAAGSSLGLVKSGGDVTISSGTITVNDNSHNHSASNITSGTLPITRGGTGATSAAVARTNLGAAPAYTYGTSDLTAGTSSLTTGTLYFVYE